MSKKWDDTEFEQPEPQPIEPVDPIPAITPDSIDPGSLVDLLSVHLHPPPQLKADETRGLRHFFDEVGREQLVSALDSQPEGSKWWQLQYMLTHSSWRNVSFSTICKKLHLDQKDLTEFWRNHNIQTGLIRQMAKLPDVMEHQADKALPKIVYCDKCEGLGEVFNGYIEDEEGNKTPKTRTCPKCKGAKQIQQDGDKDAAVLLYKSAGLIDKPGPQTAIQMNFGEAPEDTSALIGKLINGGR